MTMRDEKRRLIGWTILVLVGTSTVLPVLGMPAPGEERKFVSKPNASKKAETELAEVQGNQVQDGFSWSNMLATVVQMLFNPGPQASDKSEVVASDSSASPWANILSVGLRILTAFLGGGTSDGIDKVDNGSPLQFINIVMALLDALKTSFSQRSFRARSLGQKDNIADAAVAGIAMLKGYAKTYRTKDEMCMQKYICDANRECTSDTQANGYLYCQLGTYATSYLLERSSSTPFEVYYDAGRRGRSGENCTQLYQHCNEV